MRKLVMILAALAAAAGSPAAARPRHKTAHMHAARAPVAKTSKTEAHAASSADPALDRDPPGPMPAFGGLAALSEAQARARLGPPDIARSEGAGAMWTYRLPDCALFLFFRAGAGAGQTLHVSGASAGPRSRGQTPLAVEACIAEAQAGKSEAGKS